MTKTTRETREELRDAILELNDDLECALDEYRELKARIEAMREQRAWRIAAYRDLKGK